MHPYWSMFDEWMHGQMKTWLIGWLLPIYFNTPRKTIIMHYEEYVTGSIPPLPILIVTRATSKITRRQYKNCHRQNFNSLVKCNFKIHNRDGRCRERSPTSTASLCGAKVLKIIEFRCRKN